MEVELPTGKYVVAVSGGVDSVVLLDLLAQNPGLKLVVAHFDHGIRTDSAKDRQFVGKLAESHGLPFVFAEGKLGPNASEALAREGRYDFLNKVREEKGAKVIVTAHHQDDLLETAIINLIRGTGRRGLSSLKNTETIKRPLLNYSKQDIKNYAKKHNLKWREDPTNTNTKYLRNYIRHRVLPKVDRGKLLAIIDKSNMQNAKIDDILTSLPAGTNDKLDRCWFAGLPHRVSLEVMATWLKANDITSYDRKTLERLVIAAKTSSAGKRYNIGKTSQLIVERDKLALDT